MLVEFEIPEAFLDFTDSAVVRMGYLFPFAKISLDGTAVRISSKNDNDQGDLKREFLHLLYREKVYLETLDIRKELFKGFVD